MFSVLIASGKMKTPRPVAGVVASVVAHGAIISALLITTRPAIRVATEFEQRIAEYLFPKDRAPDIGPQTVLNYRATDAGSQSPSSIGAEGAARGPTVKTDEPDPNRLQQHAPDGGSSGTPDRIAEQQKVAESLGAFALLDVDSAAVRDPRSAAPAYPPDMEERGINGVVKVRFVVDSTGLIDLSTIKVLEKTNDSFASAVRAALPEMRFRPAMMGSQPVRQLAEQDFAFKVQVKHDTATTKSRP